MKMPMNFPSRVVLALACVLCLPACTFLAGAAAGGAAAYMLTEQSHEMQSPVTREKTSDTKATGRSGTHLAER